MSCFPTMAHSINFKISVSLHARGSESTKGRKWSSPEYMVFSEKSVYKQTSTRPPKTLETFRTTRKEKRTVDK